MARRQKREGGKADGERKGGTMENKEEERTRNGKRSLEEKGRTSFHCDRKKSGRVAGSFFLDNRGNANGRTSNTHVDDKSYLAEL